MLAARIEAADNWLGLRRLELTVYVDNEPAIALYKKHGFTIEGTRRQDAFRAGTFVDSHAMARLKERVTRFTRRRVCAAGRWRGARAWSAGRRRARARPERALRARADAPRPA